jgi:hypothetical protein
MYDTILRTNSDLGCIGLATGDVTICYCIDGVFVDRGFAILYADQPTENNGLWQIRFSDVTISMLLAFIRYPHGHDVIESLREKPVSGEAMKAWSFTQMLAMEAARKISYLRMHNQPHDGSIDDTWLMDLGSFAKEFERIAETGEIYWNE